MASDLAMGPWQKIRGTPHLVVLLPTSLHEALLGFSALSQGMGEHIGRYAGTIDVLVSAGLKVYGNDHRGHGRTAAFPEHSEISAKAALICWPPTSFNLAWAIFRLRLVIQQDTARFGMPPEWPVDIFVKI
jgi:hypothetical protein